MKKVKLSLAALTLVLAIAGTTTANAKKVAVSNPLPLCSDIDPGGTLCDNTGVVECCEDDGGNPVNEKARPH